MHQIKMMATRAAEPTDIEFDRALETFFLFKFYNGDYSQHNNIGRVVVDDFCPANLMIAKLDKEHFLTPIFSETGGENAQ
jgi:hypothetical protein